MVHSRSGKRTLQTMFAIGILLGAGFGFMVGSSPKINHSSFFGVRLFHPTPISMTIYGIIGSVAFIGIIYGIISFLSRFDKASVR
jgi:hypothetical protein